MVTYSENNTTYLALYKKFIKSDKIFTVKFYKEYEGEGGFWDLCDIYVSGPTKQEIINEKTFNTIEAALKFADDEQARILFQEKEKHKKMCMEFHSEEESIEMTNKLYWMSEFNFNFHNLNNHNLIYAHINWRGSNYHMVITYNIIENV